MNPPVLPAVQNVSAKLGGKTSVWQTGPGVRRLVECVKVRDTNKTAPARTNLNGCRKQDLSGRFLGAESPCCTGALSLVGISQFLRFDTLPLRSDSNGLGNKSIRLDYMRVV